MEHISMIQKMFQAIEWVRLYMVRLPSVLFPDIRRRKKFLTREKLAKTQRKLYFDQNLAGSSLWRYQARNYGSIIFEFKFR